MVAGHHSALPFQGIYALSGPVLREPAAVTPGSTSRGGYFAALRLHPDADKFARRLGLRFQAPGREVTTFAGTLSLGGQQHNVTITRTQNDDGEQMAVGLDGQPASLTWNYTDGPLTGNARANSSQTSLLERLALDCPDQFVLSQLRACSYMTVARNVRPASAGLSDDYNGPVWDIVRVSQPVGRGSYSPLSSSRVYYINSMTGLVEKVISSEQGQIIEAAISGWSVQSGERFPTRITWSINGTDALDLSITGVSFAAR